MVGSIHGDTKKLMVYKGKYQSTMDDDWGYPHLWKPPYDYICYSQKIPIMFPSYFDHIPITSRSSAPEAPHFCSIKPCLVCSRTALAFSLCWAFCVWPGLFGAINKLGQLLPA